MKPICVFAQSKLFILKGLLIILRPKTILIADIYNQMKTFYIVIKGTCIILKGELGIMFEELHCKGRNKYAIKFE